MKLMFLISFIVGLNAFAKDKRLIEVSISKDGASKTVEVLVEKTANKGVNSYFQGDKAGFSKHEILMIEDAAMNKYFDLENEEINSNSKKAKVISSKESLKAVK